MLGMVRDAWADVVGWALVTVARGAEWSALHPAHAIGGVVLAILFIVVYNHRQDLSL